MPGTTDGAVSASQRARNSTAVVPFLSCQSAFATANLANTRFSCCVFPSFQTKTASRGVRVCPSAVVMMRPATHTPCLTTGALRETLGEGISGMASLAFLFIPTSGSGLGDGWELMPKSAKSCVMPVEATPAIEREEEEDLRSIAEIGNPRCGRNDTFEK